MSSNATWAQQSSPKPWTSQVVDEKGVRVDEGQCKPRDTVEGSMYKYRDFLPIDKNKFNL